jgi:hypothetical protein
MTRFGASPALVVDRPRIAGRAISRYDRAAVRLGVVMILSCLILQRFQIPFGGSETSLAGPVGLAIAGVGLQRGLLTFDRRRVILYFAFVGLVFLGAAFNALMTNPFNVPTGWMSMLQFLVLSGFATLSFKYKVDEEFFFRAVNGCFAFIAIAGLLQFAAQFAGVSIFRFSDVIPARFLTEQLTGGGLNNMIPINEGNYFKSNGFFLGEPSIFSQLMAVAIAIETLYFRRPIYFGLFITALLSSVSGTGWVVLAGFVATVGVSMGRRGLLIAFGLAIGFGVALFLWSIALPDVFDAFISRTGEIFSVGSSGQIRFVTPFWIAQDVIDRAPWSPLLGVGSGVSEKFWRPYEGDIDTPIKIALENGIPVLICYGLLITVGDWTSRQRRLVPAILVLLAFTGAYAQFPPVLFPLLLITPIANLRPAPMMKRNS